MSKQNEPVMLGAPGEILSKNKILIYLFYILVFLELCISILFSILIIFIHSEISMTIAFLFDMVILYF